MSPVMTCGLLDWKMLARSERYYGKQSEVETHIAVKFILDSSKSMLHEEAGLSKMDYVRVMVAALAFLAQKQGDAVGMFALNDHKFYSHYPMIQKQHFNRLLLELLAIRNQGRWPTDTLSTQKLHDRSHKELLFFITDLHEHHTELLDLILGLKTSRNEVVVFHITGRQELEFTYKGQVIFEDLETGARVKVDAKKAKQHYLEALNLKIRSIKDALLTKGIGYQMFRLDENIGEALQVFLKKRTSLL